MLINVVWLTAVCSIFSVKTVFHLKVGDTFYLGVYDGAVMSYETRQTQRINYRQLNEVGRIEALANSDDVDDCVSTGAAVSFTKSPVTMETKTEEKVFFTAGESGDGDEKI